MYPLKITVFLSAFLVAATSWAGSVAYVEWTRVASDAKEDWGYNAFDGAPGTAWCSGPDGVGDSLTLGFIGEQKVDEIGLIVGKLDKGALDKNFARVREIVISDGHNKQTLTFKDRPDLQRIKIKPALNSQKMTFEISRTFPGERRSSPACIAEIELRHGAPVTGEKLRSDIRGINKAEAELLHLWIDQPGAPERYLSFGMDGSFQWVYAPILEGKRAKLRGTWSRRGNKLTVKLRSGKSFTVNVRVDRVADDDRIYEQLELEGEGPHPAFAASYQTGGSS